MVSKTCIASFEVYWYLFYQVREAARITCNTELLHKFDFVKQFEQVL